MQDGVEKIYNAGVPFERVQQDVGPFPTSSSGNKYLLVIIGCFIKSVEAFPLKNIRAKTVAETFVNQVISRFGVPSEVHIDQGRNFDSRLFRELSHFLGIKKTRTISFHSQSNGLVERQHQTIRIGLLDMRPQESLLLSCFGRDLKLSLDLLRGISPESEVNLSEGNARHLRFEPGNKSKKHRNKIVHLDRLASHHERHI
ncbi:hypothetical protein ACFW04_011748 [Cataglyphis niger]